MNLVTRLVALLVANLKIRRLMPDLIGYFTCLKTSRLLPLLLLLQLHPHQLHDLRGRAEQRNLRLLSLKTSVSSLTSTPRQHQSGTILGTTTLPICSLGSTRKLAQSCSELTAKQWLQTYVCFFRVYCYLGIVTYSPSSSQRPNSITNATTDKC